MRLIDGDKLKEAVKYSESMYIGYLNHHAEAGHDPIDKDLVEATIKWHEGMRKLIDASPTIEIQRDHSAGIRKKGDTISRKGVYDAVECMRFASDAERRYGFSLLEQIPTAEPEVETQMSLADCIRREDAIDAISKIKRTDNWQAAVSMALLDLPSAQPEIHFDEWCTDCKEYDHDKHCCPRFNKVIRRTVEELKAQPKAGKWEIYVISMFDGEGCKCSECGFEGVPYWDFCPNCGCRMLGVGEEYD